MEGTTVKPALTAEDWKRLINGDGALGLRTDGTMWIASEADETEDLHGTAALALHGQPFGFHHKDVDALRFCAARTRAHGGSSDADRAYADQCADVADRLAALLPPRE